MLKKIITAGLITATFAFVGCESIQNTPQQAKGITVLQDKTWILTHIGATEYKSDPNTRNIPSIQFDSSTLRVSGSDGCNRIVGTYTVRGNRLNLGQLATSQMMCMNVMQLTEQYNDALAKVTSFQAYGKKLKLLDHNGNVVLQYTSSIQPR
nr:META domain-containing protein [Acinetobacter sp. Marseille-Q1620]